MRRLAFILPLLLIGACDSAEEPPRACTLSAGPVTVSGPAPFNVRYEVTRTGDGALSEVVYRDAAGQEQRVTNPALPWRVDVALTSGRLAELKAQGSVRSGALTLRLRGDNGQGTTFERTDVCSQDTDG